MRVAEMVDVVAAKIHVAVTGGILEPQPCGPALPRQAG